MFGIPPEQALLLISGTVGIIAALAGLYRGGSQRQIKDQQIPAQAVMAALMSEAPAREMINALRDLVVSVREVGHEIRAMAERRPPEQAPPQA